MLQHLLHHCLDQAAGDLETVAGTVLDGDRLRRVATEHAHATARLERHQADSAIVGVRYPRLPSASPDHVAAARLTVPGPLDSSAGGESDRLSPGGSSALSADIVRGGSGARVVPSDGSDDGEFMGRPSTVIRPDEAGRGH